MTALVPPNAKALLTAARIGRARAQPGVTSRSHSGSSSSMLIVGGTIPRRIASMTAINSSEPLAPSAWPCIDFIEEIDRRLASSPNTVLMALISVMSLGDRAGAVGVDIVNGSDGEVGVGETVRIALAAPSSVERRRVGLVRSSPRRRSAPGSRPRAPWRDLPVRAPPSPPLPQHEAFAMPIKRSACVWRHDAQHLPCLQDPVGQRRLRSADDRCMVAGCASATRPLRSRDWTTHTPVILLRHQMSPSFRLLSKR